LNELALFAGAGGGLLASHLLGWNTVAAVEIEKYPREVLLQRQRDGMLDQFPIWDDVCTFDGRPWRGLVDVVSGGFPCQDISPAGRGDGLAGARSGLWFEYLRIVEEIRPAYVFAENSSNLRANGLGTVIEGLTGLGYDVRWGVLGAWHVGAPHKRNRMWVLAHTNSCATTKRGEHAARETTGTSGRDQPGGGGGDGGEGCAIAAREVEAIPRHPNRNSEPTQPLDDEAPRMQGVAADTTIDRRLQGVEDGRGCKERIRSWQEQRPRNVCRNVADTASIRQPGQGQPLNASDTKADREGQADQLEYVGVPRVWQTEPRLGRVADGVASRVDRLKAIGNGQVPAVAAAAFRILSGGAS